ncbi:hypothetical protein [Mesobacillus maritimus]|uniref:hypothetical protein n=1 Tax=Mesobacillus maritimus TaxID=1643336 RepID=UPI00384C0597
MLNIDFDDFYRICSDSNFEGVKEDFIMISCKQLQSNETNPNYSKAPGLEDFEEGLEESVPTEKKRDPVVIQ